MNQNTDIFIQLSIFVLVALTVRFLVLHLIVKPSKFLKDIPKQDFSKGMEVDLDIPLPEGTDISALEQPGTCLGEPANVPDHPPVTVDEDFVEITEEKEYPSPVSVLHVPDLSAIQDNWGAIRVVRVMEPFEIYLSEDKKLRWRIIDPKNKAIILVSVGAYSTERTCVNGIKSAKKSLLNPSKTILQFEVKQTEDQKMLVLLRTNSSKVVASATAYSDTDALFLIKRIKSLVKKM